MPITLTKESIFAKYKVERLEEIKNLNLWGNDIENIEIIKDLPNLEVIGLSVNKINTLQYFSHCEKLSELYLRKNCIEDLEEIIHLKNCQKLKILWLEENPMSNHPNYRQYIIKALPHLIKLDNVFITNSERELNKNSEYEDSLSYDLGKKHYGNVALTESQKRSNTFYSSRGNKIKNVFTQPSGQWEFTFSDQADAKNKNDLPYSKQTNEKRNQDDLDYMNQFKSLNELTSYFSSPDNLNKKTDTMRNDQVTSKNRNTIQNFENYNFYHKVIDIKDSVQPSLKNQSNSSYKPISNLHLIKAVFNLLEELDKTQLIYVSNLISKKLNIEQTEYN